MAFPRTKKRGVSRRPQEAGDAVALKKPAMLSPQLLELLRAWYREGRRRSRRLAVSRPSTRQLKLTEARRAYYARCKRILEEVDEANRKPTMRNRPFVACCVSLRP